MEKESYSPLHFHRPSFQLLPIPPDFHFHPDPDLDAQSPPPLLRSLPDLVHFNAINNPNHVFCLQSSQSRATSTSTPSPVRIDFTPITYHQLALAVENCCSWLLQHIAGAHPAILRNDSTVQKAPPVALFMESDVGLFIYMIALLALNIPVMCNLRRGSCSC